MATATSAAPVRLSMTDPHKSGSRRGVSRRRLFYRLAAAFALIAALLGVSSLCLEIADDAGNVIGYEFIDGQSYPIMAHESKAYRHDLERFGGKAALYADALNRWFSGLWKGNQWIRTLAFLSLGATLVCLWLARRRPPGSS